MSFTPRNRDELARLVLGSIVSRTELTDTTQGSVIDTISQAFGAVGASIERQIEKVRDAFDFRNATGAELDERLSELPPNTIQRQSATFARGELTLSFNPALSANLTINENSTFTRSDAQNVIYTVVQAYTVPSGTSTFTVTVEASQEGTAGNCASGLVNTILDAPSQITSVTNSLPFANGQEQETDTQLKRRALLYLKSLGRCQPSALEYSALSLPSTQGRLILASIYEDPNQAGYSELAIDDGSGLLGDNQRDGAIYTATAGQTGGVRVFYHEAPAVEPVRIGIVSLGIAIPLNPTQYISIPERGIIYINEGAITAGQTYRTLPYKVYTGLISEVQNYIEGDTNNPLVNAGFRACGTRVRVVPPTIKKLEFDMHLIPKSGYDLEVVTSQALTAITQLTLDLRLGQALYVAQIINAILELGNVLSVKLYNYDESDNQTPVVLDDIYPSGNAVIRLGRSNIIPNLEET
jgi:uncharacterized phage protein gp47/JayE